MPRVLPSLVALFLTIPACAHQAPVTPGPPLPAAVEVVVDTMAHECDALVAALDRWRLCRNVDADDISLIEFWKREAELDFAAGAKATIEPQAQQAIAVRCRKATMSISAATERCADGPHPRP